MMAAASVLNQFATSFRFSLSNHAGTSYPDL
jgi:hypothetical protein